MMSSPRTERQRPIQEKSLSPTMTMFIHKATLFIALLAIGLTACNYIPEQRVGQQKALEIAWETLVPNTSSQNRENWDICDARRVRGSDVAQEFSDIRFQNCPGPIPSDNEAIRLSSDYWYVRVAPLPATPFALDDTHSTTSIPTIPEPMIREAAFLIDPSTGDVIARRYDCRGY
jgi:hypothetical protein